MTRRIADKLNEEDRKFMAFAVEGALRMHALVNDLLSVARLVVAAAALVTMLLVDTIPAMAQLAILAALVVGLVGYEVIRYATQRDEVRHGTGTTTF